MTTLASDPNRQAALDAQQPSADKAPELAAPGVVEHGMCWVLRNEARGWGKTSQHYPTFEEGNQAVRIDTDAGPKYDWDTYDLLEKVECRKPDCLRVRRVAEVAYREYARRLQLEQAAGGQERQDAEASYREDRLRLERRAVECAEQRLELQREEAARSEQRLQLQTDEADRQLQLELDQAEAQRELAEAQREQAATERARWLVGHCATEIGKADAKAGVVVTLQLGLIAAAGSGVLGAAGVLRWAAIAVLLVGVLIAAWAVLPRLPRRPRRTGEGQESKERAGLNFGVVRGLDTAELAARLLDVDELTAASAEAVNLAGITHAKYVRIWWSVLTGVTGLVLALIATTVGGW